MSRASILTDAEYNLLELVSDCLIPANETMPAASEVKTHEFIDNLIQNKPQLRRLFLECIRQINDTAFESGKTFDVMNRIDRELTLKNIEDSNPEFFGELVNQTYNAYYTSPRVLILIGKGSDPPQPKGYFLEKGDLSSLEAVRNRGQIWRDS